jgi:hypothetical protein
MRNVSDKSFWGNENTFYVSQFFQKSCRLRDNAEKYCRAGQAADENMAHAHFTLGTKCYKHTLTEYVIALPQQQQLHERALTLRYNTLPALFVICISGAGFLSLRFIIVLSVGHMLHGV